MKNILLATILLGSPLVLTVVPVHASELVTDSDATKVQQPRLTLSDKAGGPPMANFAASTPAIFLTYKVEGLTKGDKIRAVWTIVDGGKGVKDAKVSENVVVADRPRGSGAFNIAKPTDGWIAGKWRADVYVGNAKVDSKAFMIK